MTGSSRFEKDILLLASAVSGTPKGYLLNDDQFILSLCLWREARGESIEARTAVARVILNRCRMAPAQGFTHDIIGNVTKKWAFSSMTAPGDPNLMMWPSAGDKQWTECCHIAMSVSAFDPDPTGGAVFYFSPPLTRPPQAWGRVRQTAIIGSLRFFAPA